MTRARPGLGQALAAVGVHTIAVLAELFDVIRVTVYRVVDRASAAQLA